jgi:hypothetical protein
MRIHRLLAVLLIAITVSVFGSITPQQAVAATDSPITIALTATVYEVYDWANVLGGTVRPGDTVTGTYTYNAAASISSQDPCCGTYWHSTAPYGMSLKVGGKVYETDPQNVLFAVGLRNNENNRDAYLVWSASNRPLSDHQTINDMHWILQDPTQTALKSIALPRTAPKLGDWQQPPGGILEVSVHDSSVSDPNDIVTYYIRAHVTQVQKIAH